MANRTYEQFQGTMERAVVKLFLEATFATGVATIVNGKGIKSFTNTGTGAYSLIFGTSSPAKVDTYQSVLGIQASFKNASTVPAAPLCNIVADTVATDGKVTLLFSDADTPAATNPADTDTLLLEITLSNSSAY